MPQFWLFWIAARMGSYYSVRFRIYRWVNYTCALIRALLALNMYRQRTKVDSILNTRIHSSDVLSMNSSFNWDTSTWTTVNRLSLRDPIRLVASCDFAKCDSWHVKTPYQQRVHRLILNILLLVFSLSFKWISLHPCFASCFVIFKFARASYHLFESWKHFMILEKMLIYRKINAFTRTKHFWPREKIKIRH